MTTSIIENILHFHPKTSAPWDHYLPKGDRLPEAVCPYCLEGDPENVTARCSLSDAGDKMMTPKDIHGREPMNDFSDHEWRFFDSPESQRHWCDIYEHARCNAQVVAAVAEYRECGSWIRRNMFPNRCSQQIGCQFFDAFPEFPEVPFLALREDARRARCTSLDSARLELRACHYPSKAMVVVPEGMHILQVAGDVTKEELDRVWQESRPKVGRRRVAADRLRDLSILQLYRYHKPWENVASYLKDLGLRQFSESCSQLCRAGRRAIEDITTVLHRVL